MNVNGGNGANGGAGGGSLAGGTGGAGGAVTLEDFEKEITGTVVVTSGTGGSAGANSTAGASVGGAGGVGGAVNWTVAHSITSNASFTTGNGGAGQDALGTTTGNLGAVGGAITITNLVDAGVIGGNLTHTTGSGSNAGNGLAGAVGGVGGAGGAIADNQSAGEQNITGNYGLITGSGGNGGSTAGTGTGAVGGAGGAIGITETGNVGGTFTITTGAGGNGGAASAAQTGGAGGAGGNATYADSSTTVAGNITVTAGAGGDGAAASLSGGTGGAGGIGGVATFSLTGNQAANVSLTGGAGGDGASATAGTGGAGGNGGTIAATIIGNIAGTVFLDDGAAGSAGAASTGTAGAAGAAGTVVLNLNATTVTGAVTVGGDGEGAIVTATSAVVFSADIGTSSKAMKTMTNNIATTYHGDVYADSIVLGSVAVNVTGTTEQVLSGAITGTGDFTVDADAIAVFKSTATLDTLVLAADAQTSLTLNDALTITNDTGLTVGAASNIVLASGIVDGETAITATHADGLDIAANLTLKMPESFNSGTITLCEDCSKVNTAAAMGRITVTDSVLATYTKVQATDKINITAVKKSAATIATALGITEDSATALDNASSAVAGDAATATIINTVLSAGGAGATQLAEQVQGSPASISSTSGAATAAAGATVISVGSTRMASLRNGNAYASTFGSGFSAGNVSGSNSMWMKPFASFGDQSERKGIAGYDADTYGLAIGADTRINAKSIVGVSFSYADTDVDGKGAGRSRSDISSYQLTAYGDYTTKDYYIEGLVGYAYNDIDSTREITATSTKAAGDTSSDQFMINLGAGMPIKVGGGAYFTPDVGLNITHVVNQAYTETGAGSLNLRIDAEDITIAKVSAGGRYHANIKTADGTFIPELRARLLYDMAGDDGSSSSTFTGGGAAFNVNGLDVVEFATSVGAGMSYTPSFDEDVSLSVNYDAELKENFTGHSANFNLRYAF